MFSLHRFKTIRNNLKGFEQTTFKVVSRLTLKIKYVLCTTFSSVLLFELFIMS